METEINKLPNNSPQLWNKYFNSSATKAHNLRCSKWKEEWTQNLGRESWRAKWTTMCRL